MILENISSVSMIGKLSSYYDGEFQASSVNIKQLLSGETTFREEAFCEELYLKSIQFDIYVHDEDEDGNNNTEKAGELTVRLFDIERCNEDEFDPMEVFDNVDQYTYEIYDMGRKHHQGIVSDNIFVIDSFVMYPDYRGKSVGTSVIHILSEVVEAQFNLKAGCLIVVPRPGFIAVKEPEPSESQYDKLQGKCESFWRNMGFEKLEDPYWYFNLDMRLRVKGEIPGERAQEKESYPKLVAESATIYEFRSRSDDEE